MAKHSRGAVHGHLQLRAVVVQLALVVLIKDEKRAGTKISQG